MMGGYVGKLLRVDLSKEEIAETSLPEEKILRQYIGGTGLGARLLYDEVDPTIKPTDPKKPARLYDGTSYRNHRTLFE